MELKYKTKRLTIVQDGEEFCLRSHQAQNFNRYDFWKDVQRLERVSVAGVVGYAIFLTNDASYWRTPVREVKTADAAFRIHEGRTISGSLQWSTKVDRGSRNATLVLRGEYWLR